MSKQTHIPPTRLFSRYAIQLALRCVVFAVGILLLVFEPSQLDVTTHFGLSYGFDFVDITFVLLTIDLMSKLIPSAKIAMGSRKQYGMYHVPTSVLFPGGISELREHARALIEDLPSTVNKMGSDARRAAQETVKGMHAAGKQLAYSVDVLRVLPWPETDLTAHELLRQSIRRRRMREIVPVIMFWVAFNVAVGLLLDRYGLFNERTALIWTLFYFVFDMICVVLWCPLQLVLMRNRCCTTCQIFNWDGIMTVTPLLVVGCWFSWILILLATVVLVRWEFAFLRHPERFDERTNASLQCANCTDKLCYLRKPFTPRASAPRID